MSYLNSAKIKKMKAFEVWALDLDRNRISLGFFEDKEMANNILQGYFNGSGKNFVWDYGISTVTVHLKPEI